MVLAGQHERPKHSYNLGGRQKPRDPNSPRSDITRVEVIPMPAIVHAHKYTPPAIRGPVWPQRSLPPILPAPPLTIPPDPHPRSTSHKSLSSEPACKPRNLSPTKTPAHPPGPQISQTSCGAGPLPALISSTAAPARALSSKPGPLGRVLCTTLSVATPFPTRYFRTSSQRGWGPWPTGLGSSSLAGSHIGDLAVSIPSLRQHNNKGSPTLPWVSAGAGEHVRQGLWEDILLPPSSPPYWVFGSRPSTALTGRLGSCIGGHKSMTTMRLRRANNHAGSCAMTGSHAA